MVKLQFDKQYKITLPKALIEAKGWQKGDNIAVSLDSRGNLLLNIKKRGKRGGME